MKTLLILPPWYRFFNGELKAFPIGLCYIAGSMENAGQNVKVYNADFVDGRADFIESDITRKQNLYLDILKNNDHPIWSEIFSVLKREKPDIVGVSVMTPKYGSSLNIARIVKEYNKNIPVIFGGIHPTVLPDETLKNRNVDIVVRGEGEKSMVALINAMESGKSLDKVMGISYISNGNVLHNPDVSYIDNLDNIPFPARHLLIDKEKYPPDTFGKIFASRGCPYKCTYCASNKIWTRQVRYMTPERVVDEIEYVMRNYKATNFYFEDDSYTIREKFVERVCDLIIKRDINISWGCETRVNLINSRMLRKMKEAGCNCINIGVESGDDETLRKINKGETVKQIEEAVMILRDNDIMFNAFFMIGFPWETEESIDKTLNFLKVINPNYAIYSIVTPYPGTELFDLCKEKNILPDDIRWDVFNHQSPYMFLSERYSTEKAREIIERVEMVFDEHNKNARRDFLFSEVPKGIDEDNN